MDDYFRRFEHRRPPEPLPYSSGRELVWQALATITALLGAWYIWWRWTQSLNHDALWFAVPLVVAESCAYLGLLLFIYNLWKDQPVTIPAPVATLHDTLAAGSDGLSEPDRPIAVDLFFATYNEDPELVRLGISDARAITYPHPIDIRIHVCDDGRRPEMRQVCDEQGVNYITRATNEGFKAGNLRHAMEQTSGDFIVIFDADTRPFPTILENTLGHFRDPKMAWVQTPQWFYDLPEGVTLTERLSHRLGRAGHLIGQAVERLAGEIRIGKDPFVNDAEMFYQVILRRRNRANAAFCCGAGSVHRREAVMEAALRSFAASVERRVIAAEEEITLTSREPVVDTGLLSAIRTEAVVAEVLAPYRFHVSEDIYTSILLHSDRERGWKSVLHPTYESRMLSPQDLLSWSVQRFKYAGGSLDILMNDNPLFRRGLTMPQRLMYGTTFWSYLAPLWNVVFLAAPVVYLATGIAPVSAYTLPFFLHAMAFLISLELAMMASTWGIAGYASKSSYLAFFPLGLRAIGTVLSGRKISFPVTPKDRQLGRHLRLVRPQIAVVVLTIASLLWGSAALVWADTGHSVTGVVTNALWGLNNCLAMSGIIRAAMWKPEAELTGESDQ
ncbi:glycosyltransferase family 2 protein [Paracoccus benzoatiresistens]|uniref:Cellulose synthase catalytic subunit n=1 Tax=Paracoccus benzoatiresistens TaxID=2997341 RepID=A0ABT4J3Y5_9RHOB|nr:cellulose synthase catalytic subunit [Paracoccus sp. EF6]MCZ0961860.1 cellulose synthase catalytic subunit [Paracoccus sp. EF6]